MSKLLLINTGGTISMTRSAQGFVPASGVVEAAVAQARGTHDVDIVTFDPLIDSAQARPTDWARIAQTIFDAHDMYDGFVIAHGTDTLAFTGAALCLSLQGLAKPVVLTGAMIPLSEPASDGEQNLRDAIAEAANASAGVWLQFAGETHHGARIQKQHSRHTSAFGATQSTTAPKVDGGPALNHAAAQNVAIHTAAPCDNDQTTFPALDAADGIVLRVFGSGTAPNGNGLRAALARAQTRGCPVIAVSQAHEGGVSLGTYGAGQILIDTGVINGRDMTAEMAYVKILFALSNYAQLEDQRAYLMAAQCGEFTD